MSTHLLINQVIKKKRKGNFLYLRNVPFFFSLYKTELVKYDSYTLGQYYEQKVSVGDSDLFDRVTSVKCYLHYIYVQFYRFKEIKFYLVTFKFN